MGYIQYVTNEVTGSQTGFCVTEGLLVRPFSRSKGK